MPSPNEKRHHNDIDQILPWYVNGTLDQAEHVRVEQHLAGCSECQGNVELLSKMQAATNADSLSPIVPKPRIDDLLDRIDRNEVIRPSSRRYSMLAIAATIVVVFIGVVTVTSRLIPNIKQPLMYETATSVGDSALINYVFLVEYEADVSTTEREMVTREIGGIEIGPGAEPGTYRVSVEVPAATVEELNLLAGEVQERSEIKNVRLIAVQLPVR